MTASTCEPFMAATTLNSRWATAFVSISLSARLTVYEIVERTMQRTQRTIEAAASNIIEAIRAEFSQIVEVECTVSKIAPPLGGKIDKVSVTLVG